MTRLTALGKGCLLYKSDIRRAFRHVKMDPQEHDKLGVCWDGLFFDTCLPFGFSHRSSIFQRLSEAIRFIMKQRGYQLVNYIDDVIGYNVPTMANKAFPELRTLISELGFELSDKKVVAPCTKLTRFGVEIDI